MRTDPILVSGFWRSKFGTAFITFGGGGQAGKYETFKTISKLETDIFYKTIFYVFIYLH